MSIKRDREALIADARSRAESLRQMFPTDGEAWDGARALLDEQIRLPDSTIRLHRHGGYVQVMSDYEIALADALEAALGVSAPQDTEWEYGSEGVEGTSDPDPRPLADDKPYWPESIPAGVHEPDAEQAASIIAKWNEGDPGSCKMIRRRKAGPWETVPPEGVND